MFYYALFLTKSSEANRTNLNGGYAGVCNNPLNVSNIS